MNRHGRLRGRQTGGGNKQAIDFSTSSYVDAYGQGFEFDKGSDPAGIGFRLACMAAPNPAAACLKRGIKTRQFAHDHSDEAPCPTRSARSTVSTPSWTAMSPRC